MLNGRFQQLCRGSENQLAASDQGQEPGHLRSERVSIITTAGSRGDEWLSVDI